MAELPPKRRKIHYLYAILSVTSVLFLLGCFGLFFFKTQQLITNLKENVNLIVELHEEYPSEDFRSLRTHLGQSLYLKEGSLEYVSREEGMRILEQDFGEDLALLGLPNPLADIFTFNVNAAYMQADSLRQIRKELRAFGAVKDVFYQQQVLQRITENLGKISRFMLIAGIVLSIIAIFLIYNTVRLALYNNRFLIKNMQLVGASWSFISWPYLLTSIRNGTISALIAGLLLAILIYWANSSMPGLELLNNPADLAILFLIILILGVLINMISTYFAVNKYLKMRVDDLY